MASLQLIGQICLLILGIIAYGICTLLLVGLAIAFKLLAIILADKLIYSILILGDLLKGIEIIELLNILVFALVGMGFGLAAALLPKEVGRKVSAILLIILVPIIFMTTQFFRYNDWIEKVSVDENILPYQAEQLTNSFLQEQIGIQGFLGFYIYTAKFPILPTTEQNMSELDQMQKTFNSKFVRFTGIPPTVITGLMIICFWGIRIFYFVIAMLSTITHFREGVRLVKR